MSSFSAINQYLPCPVSSDNSKLKQDLRFRIRPMASRFPHRATFSFYNCPQTSPALAEYPIDLLSTYRYDGLGRRMDVVNEGAAFSNNALSLWTYSDRSEVIGQNRNLGADPDNPGASVPTEDFSYIFDNIGNRETSTSGPDPARSYTANSLNQYTAITQPSVSPTHDLDGNLTYDGEKWHYSWNGENRLIEARDHSSPIGDSIRLSYAYDYLGRLVSDKKETYSAASSSFVVSYSSQFIYDGWNRIAKLGGGTLDAAYLWGLDLSRTLQGAGGIGGLLKEGSLYSLYDANGNIGQKLDNTGSIVSAVEYGPFGNIVSGSLAGDYGFSTKPFDENAALSYFGFRWYDAETGQWLSRDPIGIAGGVNLYGYVRNNSVNFWDPLGLISCDRLQEMWDNTLQAYKDATTDANWADSAITQTQNHQLAQGYAKFVSKTAAVGALAIATAGTSVAAVGPTTGVLTGTSRVGGALFSRVLVHQSALTTAGGGAALTASANTALVFDIRLEEDLKAAGNALDSATRAMQSTLDLLKAIKERMNKGVCK